MSLKGKTTQEKIWNYLKAEFKNNYGTAGLMGNIEAESGLKPRNLQNTFETKLGMTDDEYTRGVNKGTYNNFVNDKAGYGLAQWTYYSRKQKLLDYAKKRNGKSIKIGDLETQLEFLIKEIKENYPTVYIGLKNAKTVREASNIVLLQYEKPADQSAAVQTKRASLGQKYYDQFVKSNTPTNTTKEVKVAISQSILTRNPCYTSGQKITVKGLMLHSIGCPQPNAQVFINQWNSPSYGSACVHGFIDGNTGAIYQTLPWNHRGWHCGGAGNNTHIGVEMCEPACIRYTGGANFTCSDFTAAKASAKKTYDSAVKLFAYLCQQYKLNPLGDGVIVSHNEGCKRGIATNHADPEHLWNQLGTGYTMNGFRKDVAATMGNITTTTAQTSTSTPASKNSFLVKITADVLNIRSGPGTNYSIVGTIKDKGKYTIVETKNNFGKLKSGAGWISLDYIKRI